ncbi:MAG: hypothetical protein R6V58_04210 [Planctomycetota bacterium]
MKNVWSGCVVLLFLLLLFCVLPYCCAPTMHEVVVERDVYAAAAPVEGAGLEDDKLTAGRPRFDPDLVDSRPLLGWDVNKSAAVIRLDCPGARPDEDDVLLVLRPSYADALAAADEVDCPVLPGMNLIDGAAKQFDDGLYAAVDLACYQGKLGVAPSAPRVIQDVFDKLPEGSPARPFLGAALELAGRTPDLSGGAVRSKRTWLDRFENDPLASKPAGFYTWTDELKRVWRFYGFLQHEFGPADRRIAQDLADALKESSPLLEQYRTINAFYGRLTNPLIALPVDALIDTEESLKDLAKERGARHAAVAVFPPSTSPETELFERLFPYRVPAGVNLMSELIRRIQSGEVELSPRENAGWYEHQVYALETLLVPSKGQEKDKLVLTARYKQRLIEAFKAMLTKRRETHMRHHAVPFGCSSGPIAPPEAPVRPRLRLEPAPTFYLRTARAYGFVRGILVAAAGEECLGKLHGLKKQGRREPDLLSELDGIRRRFYGFYLVSCEDIGMRPEFLDGEPVDRDAAKRAALDWLDTFRDDPDLAADTRVCVPIYVDPMNNRTLFWGTLGVRLCRFEASYARPPKLRPQGTDSEWRDAAPYELDTSDYLIPVDEFAEFSLPISRTLTRAEFRAICDEHKTKEAILEALGGK